MAPRPGEKYGSGSRNWTRIYKLQNSRPYGECVSADVHAQEQVRDDLYKFDVKHNDPFQKNEIRSLNGNIIQNRTDSKDALAAGNPYGNY